MKKFTSIKFKIYDLRPLFTLLCVISGKQSQITTITMIKNVWFQLGLCPEKFQVDPIQAGQQSANFTFNMSDI